MTYQTSQYVQYLFHLKLNSSIFYYLRLWIIRKYNLQLWLSECPPLRCHKLPLVRSPPPTVQSLYEAHRWAWCIQRIFIESTLPCLYISKKWNDALYFTCRVWANVKSFVPGTDQDESAVRSFASGAQRDESTDILSKKEKITFAIHNPHFDSWYCCMFTSTLTKSIWCWNSQHWQAFEMIQHVLCYLLIPIFCIIMRLLRNSCYLGNHWKTSSGQRLDFISLS